MVCTLIPPFAFTVREESAHALQDILEQTDDRTVKDPDLFVYHFFRSNVRDHVPVLQEQVMVHTAEEIYAPTLVCVRQDATVRNMTGLKMPGLA